MKIEVLKDLEIKKPKSPSSWVGEPKYLPITRLKMSCGGGSIGGSSWYEYVYRLEKIPSNTMLNVKRYDGKSFFVNTAYVVNAENYKLVITEIDISAWASRSNKVIKETTEKYLSLIEDDEYVTLL